MAKILVIDDEPSILKLVAAYLKPEGHEVFTAATGGDGLKSARAIKPDLIVLDLMLPGIDGLEVLSQLRRESDVYVILLTARSEETDKIVGLSVGADDYVTKPFSPRGLFAARVKAGLRRLRSGGGQAEAEVLAFRHVRIDFGSRQVSLDGAPVELTSNKIDLLRTLAENRRRLLGPRANCSRRYGVTPTMVRCGLWMCTWGTSARSWAAKPISPRYGAWVTASKTIEL